MFGITNNIVPIFGMGFAAFVLYLAYREKQLKNKDKIALIEKGMDPSLVDPKSKNQPNDYKIGLLLIGAALGILVGYILNLTLGIPNFVAYSTMILVICGIVLVYFHKSKTE
jgi:antibiotic biosynthesis monooxygenase (ABM) superfamily enzyme